MQRPGNVPSPHPQVMCARPPYRQALGGPVRQGCGRGCPLLLHERQPASAREHGLRPGIGFGGLVGDGV